MGHQKAAHEIMRKLFSPTTAMHTSLGRMMVSWYTRFDVSVAVMGGFPTTLTHEWFTGYVDYCESQIIANADDPKARLYWKVDKENARLRLISRDMSMLYARGSRGQISPKDFEEEHTRILQVVRDWRANWDHEIVNPALLVKDFSYGPLRNDADIVDPYTPGILYNEPLFCTTKLVIAWLAVIIMHLCQSPTTDRTKLYAELAQHSYEVCASFELISRWPESPSGSLISAQATLAISALFLPKDKRHSIWFRRRFAHIETMG